MRVLFLPKHSRSTYFQSFLRDARKKEDWQISVVCAKSLQHVWKGIVTERGVQYCNAPNFDESPQWEQDASAVAELDRLIADCERLTRTSAGRILLNSERGIGRGFTLSSFHWSPNRTGREVLADNLSPFKLLRRRFAFARSSLLEVKPDLLLAGEWGDPLWFTFNLVARTMGIDCVVHRPSKIWTGRCYWSEDPLGFNLVTRALMVEKKRQRASTSEKAKERISTFRSTPTTLGYVQQNWDASASRRWLAEHVNLGKLALVQGRDFLRPGKGRTAKSALPLVLNHYRQPLVTTRQRHFFRQFTVEQLAAMNYFFVALHKEPEQALTYQAPFWSNQFNTVSLLSAALPAGYRLFVREHRLNVGRRPTRFYQEMARLPGVVMIDAFDSQFKYISNADLVVTDNGSTGWEALLLQRRVITLATNFFESANLACRVRDPEQLAATATELLQGPAVPDRSAHDEALGWLIDSEWLASAPMSGDDHSKSLELIAQAIAPLAETHASR